LDSVRYSNWRLDLLESGIGTLPAHIEFAGFDRINPHLKRLQEVLVKRGVKVSSAILTFDAPQKTKHIVLTNQDAECRAAVAWAKTQLNENPQASIAIVVPELGVLRSKLSALLDDVLQTSAARPALAELQRCYDFSLGVPLNSQPVIATAIHLLQFAWQRGSIFQQEIVQLLHSPYWSECLLEADARSLLDARMRRDLPLSFKSTRLQNYLHKVTIGDGGMRLPATIKALNDLISYAQKQVAKQLPSVWSSVLGQALVHADWPGRRSLSSFEYQATKSFDKVLLALAGLDDLLGNIDANNVISQLIKLCQAQIFQPESKQVPQLQIMGMMEATAAPLDAIWVMGMNDHIWPPVARPNALISATLQRLAETPNASSEGQVVFAKAIHERLIKSARSVIFSSAEQDGDRQLRTSPILHDIPLTSSEVVLAKTLAEQLVDEVPPKVSSKPWQWLDDNQAPPVEDGSHVSGGTGLLKAQAICPAWAFYQYRLYACALKEPVDGLDAMDRGNLVHQLLEAFWDGRDSTYLQSLNDFEMQTELEQAADEVLTLFNQEHDEAFSAVFLQLEKERLVKLVTTWLNDVEKVRETGFTVQAVERKQTIPIDSLSITLTVDRVDKLEDGRLVVLDYKTGGTIDFKNWANTHISEPQLPIYAAFLMGDAEVAAVCFAKVLLEKSGYAGIAANKGILQGATSLEEPRGRAIFSEMDFPDWPAVIAHWKKSINATAQSIKAGDAAVKFENEKQLAYCEVLPLLRLAERQLQFEYQQAQQHQPLMGGV